MSETTDEVEVPPDGASQQGLQQTVERQKEHAAEGLARMIFIGAGVLALVLIVAATAAVLTIGSKDATSLLAFFGSIVSALGTLLGGIVGYYYGKSEARS